MNIDSLKQRVMKANLIAALVIATTSHLAHAVPMHIDIVNRNVVQKLEQLVTLNQDHRYNHILHNYTTQRDQIKRFLRQFLNKSVDGSPIVFLNYLSTHLDKFKRTVIDPMGKMHDLRTVHGELLALYHEFIQFRNLLEANKNTKSAYILAPQFLRYKHLVFGDIQAEFGVADVLSGLNHRLICKGNNIGVGPDAQHFEFDLDSMTVIV